MFEYIVKRVLLFIPTLFLITAISFAISRLAPGDPAAAKASAGSDGLFLVIILSMKRQLS